jgi:hypothetical protein
VTGWEPQAHGSQPWVKATAARGVAELGDARAPVVLGAAVRRGNRRVCSVARGAASPGACAGARPSAKREVSAQDTSR